jgi:hypothetical protein
MSAVRGLGTQGPLEPFPESGAAEFWYMWPMVAWRMSGEAIMSQSRTSTYSPDACRGRQRRGDGADV